MLSIAPVEIFSLVISAVLIHFSLHTSGHIITIIRLFLGLCLCPILIALGSGSYVQSLAIGVMSTCSLGSAVASTATLLSLILLRPWELIPEGDFWEFLPIMFAALALSSYGICSLHRKTPVLALDEFTLTFFLLNGWFLLSSSLSTASEDSLLYFYQQMPITVLVVLLITTTVRTRLDLRFVEKILLASIAGTILCPMVDQLLSGNFSLHNRLSGAGMWGNANDIAALIILSFPFLMSVNLRKLSRKAYLRTLVIRITVFTVLLFALWWCQSRGAILGFTATLLTFFWLVGNGIGRRKFFLGVIIVLAAIFLLSYLQRDYAEMKTSKSARWNYAIAGIRMAVERPFTGVGMSQYPTLYEQYTPAFEEWGERTAHSSWILALAETGFIGIGLFVLLYLIVIVNAWQLRKCFPSLIAGALGYGVVMTFLSHTYQLLPYLLGSYVMVCHRVKGTTNPVLDQTPSESDSDSGHRRY